jgi:hypothetical protein
MPLVKEKLKIRWYVGTNAALVIIIAAAILSSITHFGNANYFRGDPKLDFDSPFYVQLLLWIKGEWNTLPSQPFRMRILIPLISSLFSDYLGVNNSFGLINSILWVLTVMLYFLAMRKLYDSSTATISAILFSFSVPTMVYGAAISTDMLGYLAIASSVLYLSLSQKAKLKNLIIFSMLMYIFVIGREVSILAIGYILFYRLLSGKDVKSALKEISIPLIFSLAGIATASIIVPEPGYTAYFYPSLLKSLESSKIAKELYQVIATYHVGWIPILITLLHVVRKKNDPLIMSSVLVGGGFVLIDHFIGIISSRFVFLTFPGFLIALHKGVESLSNLTIWRKSLKISKIIKWILLILYITVSFAATAEKNIAFPTSSDISIAKLFPEGYHQEKLWKLN